MGKLSVRTIEGAKAKQTAYKLMDGDGLQLRVATDGDKTWLVRYMIGGKERQYRLPRIYGASTDEGHLSLADARHEAARIRALARDGIDFQIQHEENREVDKAKRSAAEAENLSVRDMFTVWLRDGVQRKDGNAELMRSFEADLLPKIGSSQIKSLTEHDLRGVLRAMVARGVNRSAVAMYNNLSQMFAWCEQRQPWRRLMADGNPMALIEIEKIISPDYDMENQRERVLAPDEIRELRDIIDRMQSQFDTAPDRRSTARPLDKKLQCAIWIMLSTLCRVGELSMSRWQHVDLDARTWFIPKADVKDNVADLTIYLSEFAVRQFQKLKEVTGESEWCFPAKNQEEGHVCVKSMSKQIGDRQSRFKKGKDGNPRKPMKNRRHDNTLVLADGKNGAWTAHDLRRTGATMMQSLSISLDTIDRCQNHVLPGSKVRRHYLHHDYADEKREAWRLLGDRLELILNPADNVVVMRKA